MHSDETRPVRKLVAPLLLAVFRVDVDGGLGQTCGGQSEQIEPEPLDLSLTFDMVGEEVAP